MVVGRRTLASDRQATLSERSWLYAGVIDTASANCSVWHLFCEMAIRLERAGLGDRQSFSLPITQADLADATGLTSVHVNRMMRELRTRSIATAQAGLVTIQDWNQLVSTGDFDPAYMLLDGPSPRITEAA